MSPDSRYLLYSTIGQYVHLVRMAGTAVQSITNITEIHEELDFRDHGVWSLAWSADAKV
jgi:hypothetical protein